MNSERFIMDSLNIDLIANHEAREGHEEYIMILFSFSS